MVLLDNKNLVPSPREQQRNKQPCGASADNDNFHCLLPPRCYARATRRMRDNREITRVRASRASNWIESEMPDQLPTNLDNSARGRTPRELVQLSHPTTYRLRAEVADGSVLWLAPDHGAVVA